MNVLPEGASEALQSVQRVVLGENAIAGRVAGLAGRIAADYPPGEPQLVGIQQGARTFTRELARHLSGVPKPVFIQTTRYGRKRGGEEIRITRDIGLDISSRHVLLIQAIVDTGLTLDYLMRELARRSPSSLAACTLLDRPDLRLARIPIRYVGFQVSDEFLVGYGMEYRESYGDLPFVATLELEPGVSSG